MSKFSKEKFINEVVLKPTNMTVHLHSDDGSTSYIVTTSINYTKDTFSGFHIIEEDSTMNIYRVENVGLPSIIWNQTDVVYLSQRIEACKVLIHFPPEDDLYLYSSGKCDDEVILNIHSFIVSISEVNYDGISLAEKKHVLLVPCRNRIEAIGEAVSKFYEGEGEGQRLIQDIQVWLSEPGEWVPSYIRHPSFAECGYHWVLVKRKSSEDPTGIITYTFRLTSDDEGFREICQGDYEWLIIYE